MPCMCPIQVIGAMSLQRSVIIPFIYLMLDCADLRHDLLWVYALKKAGIAALTPSRRPKNMTIQHLSVEQI